MIRPLIHAFSEAARAVQVADDFPSRARLASDFIFSRGLKASWWPGRNRGRTVQWRGCTVHYRFNRGDVQGFREVFMDECYLTPGVARPRTILDLGANVGLASVWLWRTYQPEYLLAVEPDPDNAAVAQRNFTANHIPGQVVPAAVGARSGTAWLHRQAASNIGTMQRTPDSSESSTAIEVNVKAIDELLDMLPGGQADLVKMDIEGGEGDLLAAPCTWLTRVGALLVEFHDEKTPSAPLIAAVEAHGFTHRRINATRQDNLSAFVRDGGHSL
ncbi:MAG: FkbM family methyltransferase [Roseimicrobium sp.]